VAIIRFSFPFIIWQFLESGYGLLVVSGLLVVGSGRCVFRERSFYEYKRLVYKRNGKLGGWEGVGWVGEDVPVYLGGEDSTISRISKMGENVGGMLG
jgi:hypothetical protein